MSQKVQSTVYGTFLVLMLLGICFLIIQLSSWSKPVVIGEGSGKPTPIPKDATGTITVAVGHQIFSERNILNHIITPIPTPTKKIEPTPTPTPKPWAVMWLVEAIAMDCATIKDYTLYSDTLCEGDIDRAGKVKVIDVDDINQTVTIENVETKERAVLEVGVMRKQ